MEIFDFFQWYYGLTYASFGLFLLVYMKEQYFNCLGYACMIDIGQTVNIYVLYCQQDGISELFIR